MLKFLTFLFTSLTTIIYAHRDTTFNDTIVIPKVIQEFIYTSDSIQSIKKLIRNSKTKDSLPYYVAYNKILLQRGLDIGNYNFQSYAASKLGYYFYNISEFAISMKYVNIVLASNSKLKVDINKNLPVRKRDSIIKKLTRKDIRYLIINGSNYSQLNQYDKAIDTYIRAKKKAVFLKDKLKELSIMSNIGLMKISLEAYEDAFNHYKVIIDQLNKIPKNKRVITYHKALLSNYLSIGKCEKKLKRYHQALTYYNKGLKYYHNVYFKNYKNSKDFEKSYEGELYQSIGRVYYLQNLHTKAFDALNKAKEILKVEKDNFPNKLINDYFLAANYYNIGNKKKAIDLLNNNFKIIGEDSEMDRLDEMYKLRIKIAKNNNNKETQIKYQELSNQLLQKKLEKERNTLNSFHENKIEQYEINNQKLTQENIKITSEKKIAYSLTLTLIIFFIVYVFHIIKRNKARDRQFKKIINDLQQQNNLLEVNKSKSTLKNTQAEIILTNLSKLEKTDFFTSKNCNLYNTAKAIQTNTSYLSKALNEIKEQSFTQYLNELRINFVLRKLKEDTRFRSFTIKAISEEIGYKSVTTFLRAFKNKTDLKPSYYIERLNIENKKQSPNL